MSARLADGGLIDRSATLDFSFDGRPMRGFAGDTLASALLAGGTRLVGRSFKYHRPRGILTAGGEEPNALVELRSGARREPNTRATTAELFAGLEAASQNRWPSLKFDMMAANGLLAPIFVAGFYYKTFMWPAAFWEKVYEPAIRRAAGMGRASEAADPDSYDRMHAFCDLLIVGGGPAGLAAALTAGRSGARVILADDDFLFGGRLLGERLEIDGTPGAQWARGIVAELSALPNVRLLPRTCVFGVYDDGVHGALERIADHLAVPPPGVPRQRLWKIAARRTVLASGAVERPLVFGGNDRPGVMTASAVRTYLNRFAVAAGRRAAVFTCNDDGWKTADDLIARGVEVAVVIDSRTEIADGLTAAVRAAGVEIRLGARVVNTHGRLGLKSIEIAAGDGIVRRDVDLLAVSGGWNPSIGLTAHLGSRPVWSDTVHSFVPDKTPPGMTVAGAAQGCFGLARCLAQGVDAATAALAELGFTVTDLRFAASDEACGNTPLWRVADSRGKAFVDFQHDVTDKDVALAAREGFKSVEHLKRYTTLGMATDQGKTSNVNGHALLAEATKKSLSEAGVVLSRAPYLPVAVAAFAGEHVGKHFRPARETASHGWARDQGAVFVDAGQWKRAQWYARAADRDWQDSVNREVSTVRTAVGVCDVSTLGKIDIQGPDAAVLLDRVYINGFAKLPVGKARYGVMLREDGLVMDDGTTARLSDNRYLMSTTTVNAAKVMQHLEYCAQVLWPDLDVQLASVTEQWAQYAVAGRHARTLMQRLLGRGIDLADENFPYMAARDLIWGTVPARLFRLSFSGELAYEIAVPAQHGERLLKSILAAGEPLGIAPYGTEALSVMRIEKGHAAGAELNGQTTAGDLGFGRMMSTKKDYIGRVLADRPGLLGPERLVLTGFLPVQPSSRLRSGAHLLPKGASATAANDQGHMTSTCWSPTLSSWIGLGLLKNGAARHGERFRAYDPVRGGDVEVTACHPVFFDPEGERLHGRY